MPGLCYDCSTPDNLRLRMGLSEGSKPRVMKSRPEFAKANRHGFFVVSPHSSVRSALFNAFLRLFQSLLRTVPLVFPAADGD